MEILHQPKILDKKKFGQPKKKVERFFFWKIKSGFGNNFFFQNDVFWKTFSGLGLFGQRAHKGPRELLSTVSSVVIGQCGLGKCGKL